jgi:hypothetical protein|eukprot:COSAG02_NODE_70_length_42239_cov_15.323090_22_plen_94_part_00
MFAATGDIQSFSPFCLVRLNCNPATCQYRLVTATILSRRVALKCDVRNHTTAPDVYTSNKFPANAEAEALLAPHESLLVRLRLVDGPNPATDW